MTSFSAVITTVTGGTMVCGVTADNVAGAVRALGSLPVANRGAEITDITEITGRA